MHHHCFRLFACAAAVLMAGCTSMAPPHERPAVDLPVAYAHDTLPDTRFPSTTAALDWRGYFTDQALTRLIEQALANNLDLAKVRKNLAVVQYEQTVQNAFRDMADALSAQHWQQHVGVQERALTSQRERARLSRLSYDNGASSFLDVLDAERNLISAGQQLVQTRRALLSSRIALYAALGGEAHHMDDTSLLSSPSVSSPSFTR